MLFSGTKKPPRIIFFFFVVKLIFLFFYFLAQNFLHAEIRDIAEKDIACKTAIAQRYNSLNTTFTSSKALAQWVSNRSPLVGQLDEDGGVCHPE